MHLYAFGVIVASAVMVGLGLVRRRVRRFRLDPAIGEGFAWYALVGGFLGAHIFSVLLYFPEKVAQHPLVLLKLWEDISSFGGMLGALVGIGIYFWYKAPGLDPHLHRAYVDVAAYAFAFSLAIGRAACSLAHDHPGTLTRFPLAVSLQSASARAYIAQVYSDAGRLATLPPLGTLASLGFHDLGWYEFLYLSVIVAPSMLLLDRWFARRHGYGTPSTGLFLAAFVLLYMPARFALDFLRIVDVRYAGLTPGQWTAGAALIGFAMTAMMRRTRSQRYRSPSVPSHP
ncbi:MAG: prolipoprotein diacylglyceryl transferase [Gemmatimonadetes bacterium]|nr:prolipoprotein diacylglyceryl transferase [Gemmatimonadota bacterium]